VFIVGESHDKLAEPDDIAVTVNVVFPETIPDVAVIVEVPAATPVASPLEPAALLICATPERDELQVTAAVMFCVELSL
jgi:hypothetical protein